MVIECATFSGGEFKDDGILSLNFNSVRLSRFLLMLQGFSNLVSVTFSNYFTKVVVFNM